MNHGWRGTETGQGLLRLALLLPVVPILLAGLLDLGLLCCSHEAVTDAARAGAVYASTHPNDLDGVVARVQAAAGFVEIDGEQVEVYSLPEMEHNVVVAVSYEFTMMTPFASAMLPDGALVLRGTAIEPVAVGGS